MPSLLFFWTIECVIHLHIQLSYAFKKGKRIARNQPLTAQACTTSAHRPYRPCAQGQAHRLQAHCAMNAALPAPGAWCASAALYCACAFTHAPALNAALPASFAAVSARSLFRPRAAAAQSGSRRSACEDEFS